MKRGTTPVHKFTLPFELPEGTEYRVVYAQGKDHEEKILIERTTDTCTIDGKTLTLKLEAKETLRFDCTPHHFDGKYEAYPVKIQIGARTPTGDTFWSDIIITTVECVLRKDGTV